MSIMRGAGRSARGTRRNDKRNTDLMRYGGRSWGFGTEDATMVLLKGWPVEW